MIEEKKNSLIKNNNVVYAIMESILGSLLVNESSKKKK